MKTPGPTVEGRSTSAEEEAEEEEEEKAFSSPAVSAAPPMGDLELPSESNEIPC